MKKREYPCSSLSYIALNIMQFFYDTQFSPEPGIFLGLLTFSFVRSEEFFSACQHIASLVVDGGISDPSRVNKIVAQGKHSKVHLQLNT